MNTWTIIVGTFTILGIILTIVLVIISSLDKKIDQKINNPEFIKKVAGEVRLPFAIFDEKNRILYDNGALEYIDDINVEIDKDENIKQITIKPKKFMSIAPLLESVNFNYEFSDPERYLKISWRFFQADTKKYFVVSDGEKKEIGRPLVRKFKITVIK